MALCKEWLLGSQQTISSLLCQKRSGRMCLYCQTSNSNSVSLFCSNQGGDLGQCWPQAAVSFSWESWFCLVLHRDIGTEATTCGRRTQTLILEVATRMPLPGIPHSLPRYVREHCSLGMPKSGPLEGVCQVHLSIHLSIFVKCQLCAIHYAIGTEDNIMGKNRQPGIQPG